ncbi:Presenilins-associated rhomboid-like protein, mitochondrial [Smittium culicis]|uniref:Presenilins-associated rhomboid-like protein, mitochondrial n=1 Tax=Smittium culicis TaxID=133412 RepID=A0A1R1Y0G9_9FUNG|nr:Presenilins-associated rhomboid-like protein, mitochondrial [Smittium culicis]
MLKRFYYNSNNRYNNYDDRHHSYNSNYNANSNYRNYQEEHDHFEHDYHHYQKPEIKYGKQVAFTLAFVGTSFATCGYLFVKDKKDRQEKERLLFGGWQSMFWGSESHEKLNKRSAKQESNEIFMLEGPKYNMAITRLTRLLGSNQRIIYSEDHKLALLRISILPDYIPDELKKMLIMAADNWYALPKSKQTTYKIVAINAAVFLMWKVKRLNRFMGKHFLHDPKSTKSYTLLTSAFSHNKIWHFGFNMFALSSFAPIVLSVMPTEEFLAFYLSSAVAASLISHIATALIKSRLALPSLGASGALYSVLVATSIFYPESKVSLMFIPYGLEIQKAVIGIVGFDLVMAIINKSIFDHYAHLGGAASGYLYVYYGHSILWKNITEYFDRTL